jgi:hypothetical protein
MRSFMSHPTDHLSGYRCGLRIVNVASARRGVIDWVQRPSASSLPGPSEPHERATVDTSN